MADSSYSVELILEARNTIGTAASAVTRDLGRIDDGIKRVEQSGGKLENSFRRVQNALELGIAGAALRQVGDLASKMYDLGTSVDIASQTFTQLSGGSAAAARQLDSLRQATGGIISDFSLMQGASKYLSMGLGETQAEVTRLTELAVRLGGAMGNDAASSINDFALLLANESVLRLDTFGISSERVRQRIEELLASGEALNRSDAFRLAVMEEGANSLDRLGAAANAAETPLARLQTRVENIAAALSSGFATGVDTLLALAEGIDTYTRASVDINERAVMLFGDPGAQYSGGRVEPIQFSPEQLRIAELSFQVEEQMRQLVRGLVTGAADEISRLANLPAMQQQAALSGAQVGLTYDLGMSRMNDIRSMYYDGMSYNGSIGDQTLFTSEAARMAASSLGEIRDALEAAQGLNEQGIITDEQLEMLRNAADYAGEMTQNIIAGADAFRNMTLSQAFGEGVGSSPLGNDLSGQFLDFMRGMDMPESDFAKLQDTILLASGQVTEASIVFRDQVLPLVQAIFESQGAGAAAEALANLETFLQDAALAGYSPEQIATMLPGQTGYVAYGGGGGGQFTVNPGDTPLGIAAQYGMTLAEVYAGVGTTNPYAMMPGVYGMGGGMQYAPADAFGNPAIYGYQSLIPGIGGAASDAASATDPFKAMSDSTEKIASDIDNAAAVLEEIGSKNYTVKLDIEAAAPAWLIRLLQMNGGTDFLAAIVSDNGGTTPGYNPRGTARPVSE